MQSKVSFFLNKKFLIHLQTYLCVLFQSLGVTHRQLLQAQVHEIGDGTIGVVVLAGHRPSRCWTGDCIRFVFPLSSSWRRTA